MAAVLKPRVIPLGTAIDSLWALREQKRALEADVKLLEENIKSCEEALIERLDAEGLDKSTGKAASVSITSTQSAAIDDFEELTKYVKRSGHFHLFQRRISDPAARELFETKGKVPGLSLFTKRRLNLRSLSKE